MEVSRGTAYGIALAQVAVTLGVVLFSPSVDVNMFYVRLHLNTSVTPHQLTTDGAAIKGVQGGLALPVMMASGIAAVFSTVTYQSHESGITGQDFQQDVMDQVPMWDLLFWVYVLISHGISVFVVADPVDVFGAIASTSFMAYFLYRACAPKGQMLNLTQENLNILGYCIGILMVCYQMTDVRGNGASIVMLVVVLDYFLGIGHTYDRQATMDTVSNCRLFYVCAGTLGTALMYVLCDAPANRPILG